MKHFFFILGFFISCVDGNKTLPSSTGKNSEIIFVVDDLLWQNSVDNLVKGIFEEPIHGVGQNERMFELVQINHHEFKSIFQTHRNIVIISKTAKTSSEINKWASPQFVAQLNWEGNIEKLKNELVQLRRAFFLKEVRLLRDQLSRESNKKAENTRASNFGADLIIPKEYQILNNDSILFWAHYNPAKSDEIKNILTFSFLPTQTNFQIELLHKTDSFFSKYLKGEKEGSYVRIEPEYIPYYSENTYRGLWKLENGFMGGPFLIKSYFVQDKIIVNIGLVFAPQSRKRRYIKEFEAIL
mgnify:CR=1 FL=1